jgi:hypothetical protein
LALSTKVAKSTFIGGGPVRYRLETSATPGAPSLITLEVEYADVVVPTFYYVADHFRVQNLDSSVLLVFGKLENLEKRDRLRTKLEIYFSGMPFVTQLWKNSRDFHKTLRGVVGRYQFEPESPGPASIETDKTQTINSNNVLMALSGFDSLIDFYYLSPREISVKAAKRRPNIELEPLARVILPPPMLLGLLDACEGIAESLSARFSIDEREEVEHGSLESD